MSSQRFDCLTIRSIVEFRKTGSCGTIGNATVRPKSDDGQTEVRNWNGARQVTFRYGTNLRQLRLTRVMNEHGDRTCVVDSGGGGGIIAGIVVAGIVFVTLLFLFADDLFSPGENRPRPSAIEPSSLEIPSK